MSASSRMCMSLWCLAAVAWNQDAGSTRRGIDLLANAKPIATLFAALLVVLTLALLPLAWRLSAFIAGTGRDGRPGESKPVAWGFAQIALVFSWVVLFLFGMRLFVSGGETEPDLSTLLSRSALTLGTTAVLIAGIAHFLDPEGMRALGLRSSGTLRGMLGGWSAYAALLPGWIGLTILWRWFLEHFGISSEVQVVITKFLELRAEDVPSALVLGIGVMPFLEELIFRGFLQPVFVKHVGAGWGVVATSLLFGAMHGPSACLPIFGLSLVLGAVMLRTQRLLASWAVHALHNGLVFGALLFLRAHPELVPKASLLAFS